LEKGDSVVTSGYSLSFPPGILIGTVNEILDDKTSNFYSITLIRTYMTILKFILLFFEKIHNRGDEIFKKFRKVKAIHPHLTVVCIHSLSAGSIFANLSGNLKE
jgi:hypothetical protein